MLNDVMLSAIMLNAVMLSFITMNIVMLSVTGLSLHIGGSTWSHALCHKHQTSLKNLLAYS